MEIIKFYNYQTAMMSSVYQLTSTKPGIGTAYIVHLDDLDSDRRVQPSRICKDVDQAAAYAENLVGA